MRVNNPPSLQKGDYHLKIASSLVALLASLLFSGCFQASEFNADKGYLVATRRVPPEPVYNRVFLARPPEVMPAKEMEFTNAPRVLPVIHLELKAVTLETVAQTLGGSARYRSYCAASIADKKFSIDALGTIDELADIISKKADVYVSVDHANREVRFLPQRNNVPRLYNDDKFAQPDN